MHHPTKQTAKIYSTGVHFPSEIVKSDDLLMEIKSESQYNIPHTWMSEVMGIEERRVAPSKDKPSDLAIPAAIQALEGAPYLDQQEIDLVIFCGIERDQSEPATAHTVQHKLGLNARFAFDMANACFGFVDAMQIATNYISCGIVRYALIVTGEIPSRVSKAAIDLLREGVDIKMARNIIGALSVGDAGGAAVIGPTEAKEQAGFELFNTVSYSHLADKCIYKQREDGTIEGQMIMGQIAGAVVKSHVDLIGDTLSKLGWSEFDWVLSHQIGQRPFDRLSNMEGVQPDKMVKTLDKFGNITSATFPVNFHKMVDEGRVARGDKVGGCFAGSGLVIGQFGYTY